MWLLTTTTKSQARACLSTSGKVHGIGVREKKEAGHGSGYFFCCDAHVAVNAASGSAARGLFLGRSLLLARRARLLGRLVARSGFRGRSSGIGRLLLAGLRLLLA